MRSGDIALLAGATGAACKAVHRRFHPFDTAFRRSSVNTFKPVLVVLAIAALSVFTATAQAQAMDHSKMGGMSMPATKTDSMPAAMTEGEVRKVDKDSKKITLKHAEIKNLDMPGMTMVFPVRDAAMLDKVKAGDKVRFTAEKAEGTIVVTSIEVAR